MGTERREKKRRAYKPERMVESLLARERGLREARRGQDCRDGEEQIYWGVESEWVSRISGTGGDRSMGCAQTNRNMGERTQM